MSKLQEDPRAFGWVLLRGPGFQEPSLLVSSFLAVLLTAEPTRHAAFRTGDALLYCVQLEGDDGSALPCRALLSAE